MKRQHLVTVMLGVIVVALVVFQYLQPQPIDWSEDFRRNETKPHGCTVLYGMLEAIRPERALTVVRTTPEDAFLEGEVPEGSTYMIVTGMFNPDSASMGSLMDFVRSGGTLFLVTDHAGIVAGDSMRMKTDVKWDSTSIDFTNPRLKSAKAMRYPRSVTNAAVMLADSIDSAGVTVLAVTSDDEPVFVRRSVGDGAIYFLSMPRLLGNYGILVDTVQNVADKILAYLPAGEVVWDEHFKPGQTKERQGVLRYVANTEPLAWAWYVTMAGLALFVVVHARRRQRAIPVLDPVRNTTVEFVHTVAMLYHHVHDNRDLVEKLQKLFLDHVRTRLRIRTDQPQDVMAKHIATTAGVHIDVVNDVFQILTNVLSLSEVTDDDVIRVHDAIMTFHSRSTA